MYEFFKSHEFFNFELTRILGTAVSGGCEVAEFLDAVSEIKRNDPESWYRAFFKQGEKAERLAKEAEAVGHMFQTRNALLRASNYFKASQYMMFDKPDQPDPRVLPLLERSVENFVKAVKLLDGDVKLLDIEFEGHQLPAYLYLPHAGKRVSGKTPIVICNAGADSTQEELYHALPCTGPGLGYAVLTFEGPGQGIVLRRDKIYQRPDWEVVTKAVLDHLDLYANLHPTLDLDTDRIALTGLSLGGYYALRGAVDPRVKAVVAIDAFYDMWDLVTSRMPPGFIKLWTSGWIPDWLVDRITYLQGRLSFQSYWEFQCSSWILGVQQPVDLLRKMREFTLRLPDGGEILEKVECPVLASGAGHSIYFDPKFSVGKIMLKLEHLEENKKEVWTPTLPGEGGLQAKVGAWPLVHEKTFRFLDHHLGVRRVATSMK